MARPKGNQTKKRKQPPGRGAPASKRRVGKGAAADVYEAEDSDPDEVKHAKRYDSVENYEYEMPSDFEDEEIDEDLAFTAEDKKKFGGWFDDWDANHGAAGAGASSDEDGGFDDDEQEEAEGFDEEAEEAADMTAGREGGQEETSDGDHDASGLLDEEDEALLGQLGASDDGDDEQEGDEAEDAEYGAAEDDIRYREMVAQVLGGSAAAGKTSKQARVKQAVVDEAYPEAEFALAPGAATTGAGGELSLADLMKGLDQGGRQKLPAALRKELERMNQGGTKSKLVSAPAPRVIRERAERQAGYQATSQEVSKWQPLVKANREAPTLAFTAARDEVPRLNTTAALVAQHTPETAMEAEVEALLQAAGAATATAVAAAEEALAVKALSLEEARERRNRLAKLRSLLFYHEQKAKRLKTIKSKEYRKKMAKAEKKKGALVAGAEAAAETGDGLGDDDEAVQKAQEELQAAEFDRAKERLTLKHKNTSRWARRALKRGATLMDAGTRAAVGEQLRLGDALRRRIEGQQGSDDEDDVVGSDDQDGSMLEGEAGAAGSGRGMSNRAKALALDILSGKGPLDEGQEAPKKGLFALPFMARALERKRIAAMQEANATLQQLQSEGAEGELQGAGFAASGGFGGRRQLGGANGAQQQAEEEEEHGLESDQEEDAEAKAERLQKLLETGGKAPAAAQQQRQPALQRRRAAPTAADEADLDQALVSNHSRLAGLHQPAAVASTGQSKGHHHHHQQQQQQQQHSLASSQFISAKSYSGSKPGYAFKLGPQGLGYYADPKQQQSQQAKKQQAGGKPQAGKAGGTQPAAAVIAGQQQQQQAGKAVTSAAGKAASKAAEQGPVTIQGQSQQPSVGAPASQQVRQQASQLQAAGKASKSKEAEGVVQVHNPAGDEDGGSEEEGEGMQPAPASKAAQQKALVSMAFAGDDVEAEFAAEKAAEVAAELPQVEEPSLLPGWGAWSAQQRNPKWMRDARAKAQKQRDKAEASRADAGLKFVVLSEKWDKKAMSKYTVQQVPFPYDGRDTYERSIRQPLGRQYNPDGAFRDLTRPAVLKTTGVMINPIKYSKPLAKQAADITGRPAKAKVLTVAGGVLKKPKKATK